MNESEAKTKWCPFARAATQPDPDIFPDARAVTINRNDVGQDDLRCRCLGSSCMAWRWLPEATGKSGRCGMLP